MWVITKIVQKITLPYTNYDKNTHLNLKIFVLLEQWRYFVSESSTLFCGEPGIYWSGRGEVIKWNLIVYEDNSLYLNNMPSE